MARKRAGLEAVQSKNMLYKAKTQSLVNTIGGHGGLLSPTSQTDNVNCGFEPEVIRLNSSDEMYFEHVASEASNEEQNKISVS